VTVDLKITGRVESLHLEPGDRIVVSIEEPARFTPELVDRLMTELKSEFPEHNVLILSPGLRITKEAVA
jgi:hypothetical protein